MALNPLVEAAVNAGVFFSRGAVIGERWVVSG